MSRTAALGVVLMVVALFAYAAIGGDERRNGHLKAQACARDHIAPADCKHMEGDHIWPLCAHGPDVLENIQLQPCDQWDVSKGIPECVAGEAYRKDLEEWHWCGLIRHGEATPEQAGAYFLNHKRCSPGISGCW